MLDGRISVFVDDDRGVVEVRKETFPTVEANERIGIDLDIVCVDNKRASNTGLRFVALRTKVKVWICILCNNKKITIRNMYKNRTY